eukprot:30571-Amphidinium_carterae.1
MAVQRNPLLAVQRNPLLRFPLFELFVSKRCNLIHRILRLKFQVRLIFRVETVVGRIFEASSAPDEQLLAEATPWNATSL